MSVVEELVSQKPSRELRLLRSPVFATMLVEGSDSARARDTAADVAIECGDGVRLFAHRCVLVARLPTFPRCVHRQTIVTSHDAVIAVMPWSVSTEASSAAVQVCLRYAYSGNPWGERDALKEALTIFQSHSPPKDFVDAVHLEASFLVQAGDRRRLTVVSSSALAG